MMDKKSLVREIKQELGIDISEEEAEEVLDDLVAVGILNKFDPDGNPEHIEKTEARMKRVRESLEDALVKWGVAQALNDGIVDTDKGLAIKDKDKKEKES